MKKIILILFLAVNLLPTVRAQQYGWTDLTSHLPYTMQYGGLGEVVFVGQHGWLTQNGWTLPRKIFYTPDGGNTFTTQYLPVDAGSIGGIFMRSASEGYLVTYWDSLGNMGKIFHTTDAQNGGWTLLNEVDSIGMWNICFPPPPDSVGYICTFAGEVWKLTGDSVSLDTCLTNNDLYGITFPVTSEEGWTIGADDILHRDSTGWVIDQYYMNISYLTAICFLDNHHGWVCGCDEAILHTVDGHNWINQMNGGIGMGPNLFDIDFCDPQNGWACGYGRIYHTVNGGSQWLSESQYIDENTQLTGLCALDPFTAYAVGTDINVRPVFLKYGPLTGLEEPAEEAFRIYPNPAAGGFTLESRLFEGHDPIITLSDIMGNLVAVKLQRKGPGSVGADVGNLPAGVHSCRITAGMRTVTQKVIIY